jgi:DNA-binding response OmpR family regulator
MKILVIEDEISIANLLKKGLEMEQYAVELAHDGQTGLDKASKNNYDLIITDIMLPTIDGMELCRLLRSKNIETPIIMLTARDAAEDKVLGLDAGADDYLVKPFTFEKLNTRIKAVLRLRKIKDEMDA